MSWWVWCLITGPVLCSKMFKISVFNNRIDGGAIIGLNDKSQNCGGYLARRTVMNQDPEVAVALSSIAMIIQREKMKSKRLHMYIRSVSKMM